MATNFIQNGKTIDYTATSDISSGAAVLLTAMLCIAATDIANGETGALETEGVWTLPKATGEAWTKGCKLYWDASAGKLTTTSTDNVQCAKAWTAAASADATGDAKINV